MSLQLDTPVQYVKGVGPKLGDILRRRGIQTVSDLLDFYPRTYEDRRALRSIQSLVPDQLVSLTAQVLKVQSIPLGRSQRRMWEVVVGDETGRVGCKFFRTPYKGYFERFQPFQKVRVIGKVGAYKGRIEFHHPDIHPVGDEETNENEIIPIYVEIEGISSHKLSKLVQVALQQPIQDWLPAWVREKYDLMPLEKALHEVHKPPVDQSDLFLQFKAPAQKRIIFDEFFAVEAFMAGRKKGVEKEKAFAFTAKGKWPAELEKSLEFDLTGAQKSAFAEIVEDLRKPHPMHRLVQGDVGSGKTLVALMAAVFAAESGFQTALMVPTEILAEQHFKNASARLGKMGLHVSFLSGSMKASERNQVLEDIRSGKTSLCIGTHALIENDVEFKNLGLVIVDEQHRFGVEQRNRLKRKGVSPHFLVMTATPIPRTLAMTVYGDLDVSIINELPKGRQPIQTRKAFESKRSQVMNFIREHVKQGRQAYIVCPLVEESEKIELKNAQEEFEKAQQEFSEFKVGLLHGRMKPAEKDEVMNQFRRNEIQILVSTTVIEVGVDVPNANIMLIEHTERFGLSQLHQLRGRVGRGSHKSYCILMLGYALSEEAQARAEIMERTNDGFKIAEADLEMRGPGEFLGTRQSGLAGFKMAHLVRDLPILQEARKAAFELIDRDPELLRDEHQLVRQRLEALSPNWVG